MKVAIAAHGRFVAFDYARELIRQGHDVTLFTNYPRSYVERWGIPRTSARTLIPHGAASRLAQRRTSLSERPRVEAFLHQWFGRWVARALSTTPWDVVICLSSIGEETFRSGAVEGLKVCARFSTHIRTQMTLLREEQARVGRAIELPSQWMIDREEREYALADRILVPSTFVLDSFVKHGVARERICMVPFGVDPGVFRPAADVVNERRRRIRANGPLRIAYVGTISLRKGMWDFLEICRALPRDRFQITLTGAVHPDAASVARDISQFATIHKPVPQNELPARYADADLFVFPTIEDGHPYVLNQAMESAVPILCSTNCSGPDILTEDVTGWVIPARRPDLFVERLLWCDRNRTHLSSMVGDGYERFKPRTWADSVAEVAARLSPIAA
ncbi:MAG TPA: glycosyltransferase family 4 protein [Vicinamibacterales bacterium]